MAQKGRKLELNGYVTQGWERKKDTGKKNTMYECQKPVIDTGTSEELRWGWVRTSGCKWPIPRHSIKWL